MQDRGFWRVDTLSKINVSSRRLFEHKRIENAMKYVGMINFKTDDFEVSAKSTVEEAKVLLDTCFDFVMEKQGISLFRRPKRFANAQSPSQSVVHKRETNVVSF